MPNFFSDTLLHSNNIENIIISVHILASVFPKAYRNRSARQTRCMNQQLHPAMWLFFESLKMLNLLRSLIKHHASGFNSNQFL